MTGKRGMHACFLINNTCVNPVYHMAIGGAERQLFRFLPYYERKIGHVSLVTKFTTFAPARPATRVIQLIDARESTTLARLVNRVIQAGLVLPSYMVYTTFACVALARLHAKHGIDVLNIHIDILNIPFLLLCKILGIKVFFTLTAYPWIPPPLPVPSRTARAVNAVVHAVSATLFTKAIRVPDMVQALNGEIADVLVSSLRVPPARVASIPNAIDCAAFRDQAGPGTNVLGYVGRLHPVKNLPALIEATSIVAKRHPGTRLVITGEGPERDKLGAMVAGLDLAGNVTFTGFMDDQSRVHASYDIFVLPSTSEGMSISLLEAMAAGKPVLASNIPANSNVVEDGVEALLFNPRDPADIAAKIERLLTDARLRDTLGRNAARKARSTFDIDVVTTTLVSVMRHLARGKHDGAG